MEYTLTLTIGYPTAIQQTTITNDDMGYDDETWEKLSNTLKEKALNAYLEAWIQNYLEYYWSETDDDA